VEKAERVVLVKGAAQMLKAVGANPSKPFKKRTAKSWRGRDPPAVFNKLKTI